MIGDLGFDLTAGVCDEICDRLRAREHAARDRERAERGPDALLDDRAGQGMGLAFGHVWRASTLVSVGACILGQVDRPYPCAARQTLTCDEDLRLPRERFRVFFGSFDWHSCVHSHWTLVRLLADGCLTDRSSEVKRLGYGASGEGLTGPELQTQVLARLEASFDAAALAAEARSWSRDIPDYEERPYGHTWLLALDTELDRLAGQAGNPLSRRALRWRTALAPLADEMVRRVRDWVAGLVLPTRSGIHSDTAWSLAMAWDWAQHTGDDALTDAVRRAALRLYACDVQAPVAYEPQGDTFSSPLLNEAALMARVLDEGYEGWLRGFLPQVFADPEADLPLLPDLPAEWDGASYLGVHEVALPLARALAARDAAAPLPAGCPARPRLEREARRWVLQGLEDVRLDGYLADHWVGTFVGASLMGRTGRYR